MDHTKIWEEKNESCSQYFLTACLRSCLLQLLFSVVKENVKVHRIKKDWCVTSLLGDSCIWLVREQQSSAYPPEPQYLLPLHSSFPSLHTHTLTQH